MNRRSKQRSIMFKSRRQRGVYIAETAAALCLILPISMMVIFVMVECTYGYIIQTIMMEAAREAARDLSIAYEQYPAVASSRVLQDALVLDNIRFHNMVNDSRQFSNPVFNTAANPPTVSVTVTYRGSQYGLPAFPTLDPLRIGSINIVASSIYRLQT